MNACKPNPFVLLERLKVNKDFRSVSAALVETAHITDLTRLVPKIEIRALSEEKVDKHASSSSPQNTAHDIITEDVAKQGESRLSCPLCSKTFTHVLAQRSHTKSCGKQYVCVPCGRNFKHQYRLTIHLREVHSGEKPFACKACPASFKRKVKLRQHLLMHISGEAYSCTVCSMPFSQPRFLEMHMKSHGPLAFESYAEGGETTSESDVNSHAGGVWITGEDGFHAEESCWGNSAEAVWPQDGMCKDQQETEFCLEIQPDVILSVDDGSEDQKISLDMKERIESHAGTVFLQDGSTLGDQQGISSGMKESLAETKTACLQDGMCADQLGTSLNMEEMPEIQPEIILTDSEGPSYQGISLNTNKSSSESHSGTRPKFNACTEPLAYGWERKEFTKTRDGQYLCVPCSKVFKRRNYYMKHLREVHSQEKPFSCAVCSASFKRKATLSKHLSTHTNEKPYSCHVCSRKFSLTQYLSKHMKTHAHANLLSLTSDNQVTDGENNNVTSFSHQAKAGQLQDNMGEDQQGTNLNMEYSLKIEPDIILSEEQETSTIVKESSSDSRPGIIPLQDEGTFKDQQRSESTPKEMCSEIRPEIISIRGGVSSDQTSLNMKEFSSDSESQPEMVSTQDMTEDQLGTDISPSCSERVDSEESHFMEAYGIKFGCTHCPQQFSSKVEWMDHLKDHLAKNPACTFYTKPIVNASVPNEQTESGDGSQYTCAQCSKTFLNRRGWRYHLQKVHSDNGPFFCSLCPASFKFNRGYQEHFKTHSSGTSFPCPRCRKAFSSLSNLKRHRAICTDEMPSFRSPAENEGEIRLNENMWANDASVSRTNQFSFENCAGISSQNQEGINSTIQEHHENLGGTEESARPNEVCLEDPEGNVESLSETQPKTVWLRDEQILDNQQGTSSNREEFCSRIQPEIIIIADEETNLNIKEFSSGTQPEIILSGDESSEDEGTGLDMPKPNSEIQPEIILSDDEDTSEDERTSLNMQEPSSENEAEIILSGDEGSSENEGTSLNMHEPTSENESEIILSGDEGTSEDKGTSLNVQEPSSKKRRGKIWIKKGLGCFEGEQDPSSNIEESSMEYDPEKIRLRTERGSIGQQDEIVVQMGCTQCPEQFSSTADWIKHFVGHFGKNPHVCSLCTKPFIDEAALERHMKSHDTRTYSCVHCSKKFMSRSKLTSHLKEMHGIAGKVCRASFTREASFAKYLQTHDGEKPYACTICPWRFTKPQYLRFHLQTHNNGKPFSCPRCSKTYKLKEYVASHMRKVHSDRSL